MFCPRCRVHFAGTSPPPAEAAGAAGGPAETVERRCPYCGGQAEDTAKEVEPKEPLAPAPPPGTAEPTERTRTEAPHEGILPQGSVVAGKYEVVACLGSGGFGTVYKVRHVFRKKYYALKTPHAEFSRNDVFRRRFEREIEAMERFVHPDVVTIRDSGITQDLRPYYTMDFVEGESLKVVLAREGKLRLERVVSIVASVLRVLDVAHRHRIIHRDIKPENILLTMSGGREAVRVLDFGIAKLLDLAGDSANITGGTRVGTPQYMSPEQINGEAVDERSDLFSLGIVAYELITGRHPFAMGRDPIRITAAILNRDPEPPGSFVPDLPKFLESLILDLIEKKPRRRPATAAEALDRLGNTPGPVLDTPVEVVVRLHPGAPRRRAQAIVLRQATESGERRCFLLFGERAAFGRSNDPARGVANHLIWRCLPCRSAALDPENWQRNLTISQSAGTIGVDGSAVVIEPSPDSRHGILIGGVKSHRTARIDADRFHLGIGDRALELDGGRFLRSSDEAVLDLEELSVGRPVDAVEPPAAGFSNPSCRVDCVRFLRPSNWPLHEYYLVPRRVTLGASVSASLRLTSRGVEGLHASILHEGGEAFFLALRDGVSFAGVAVGAAAVDLPRGTLLPFVPGLEIMVGDARLIVDAAQEADFKSQ